MPSSNTPTGKASEAITTESISVPGTPESSTGGNDDYRDDSSTSGRLTINNSISGELEDIGDRDWFAVDLTAGNNYQFDLTGESLADPWLYLRNTSSLLIDYNDDQSDWSLDSQITFVAEQWHPLPRRWFADDVYTGTYTLRATQLRSRTPTAAAPMVTGMNAQRAEQYLGISLDQLMHWTETSGDSTTSTPRRSGMVVMACRSNGPRRHRRGH